MPKIIRTAIVFFESGGPRPRKYRNISNMVKFGEFCANSGAWYINWYDAKSGEFERRTYLKSDYRKK
jgi:hypothetical protein